MVRRARYLACLLGAAVIAAGGCVPTVGLDVTPCPCGPGSRCCAINNRCVPAQEDCPERLAASSARRCAEDEGCVAGELCHAWTVDGVLAGSQQCRRDCTAGFPCGAGERCQLAPHDGQPLDRLQTVAICLPDTDPVDCEQLGCGECTPERMGKTFCKGDELHGCLIAAHPTCGVTCQQVKLALCETCSEQGGVVDCPPPINVSRPAVCQIYGCAACPTADPFCEGEKLRTCQRATFGGEPQLCNELCRPADLATCERGCSSGPDGEGTCNP